ncbi:hypothetical protein EYC80_002824 [Monilinia laxa]|uniref:Uncharacterized protein n=1 Tax=Monilinia laxa TaxID=61186 RepID=A0A5N6KBV8_MONLA|nr:hypothetical protein EYC80_002824 [Monilinia laxa]
MIKYGCNNNKMAFSMGGFIAFLHHSGRFKNTQYSICVVGFVLQWVKGWLDLPCCAYFLICGVVGCLVLSWQTIAKP